MKSINKKVITNIGLALLNQMDWSARYVDLARTNGMKVPKSWYKHRSQARGALNKIVEAMDDELKERLQANHVILTIKKAVTPKKCSECGHEKGFRRNQVTISKWLCQCPCHNIETI